jgi:hypothetical protein
MTYYGIVYYEDETGDIRRVLCPTEVEYSAELEAGSRWVEDEPRRFRNLWGSVCEDCGGSGVDPGSLRKPEACPPCNGDGQAPFKSAFYSMTRSEGIQVSNQMEEYRRHREAFGI